MSDLFNSFPRVPNFFKCCAEHWDTDRQTERKGENTHEQHAHLLICASMHIHTHTRKHACISVILLYTINIHYNARTNTLFIGGKVKSVLFLNILFSHNKLYKWTQQKIFLLLKNKKTETNQSQPFVCEWHSTSSHARHVHNFPTHVIFRSIHLARNDSWNKTQYWSSKNQTKDDSHDVLRLNIHKKKTPPNWQTACQRRSRCRWRSLS